MKNQDIDFSPTSEKGVPAASPADEQHAGLMQGHAPPPAQAQAAPEAEAPPAAMPVKKQRRGWKKALHIVGNVLFTCLLLLMVGLVFSMVQSRIRGGPPEVAGHQMYIVLSGSMSPAFEAGSLAFVQPVNPSIIGVGDIITFHCASGG